MRDKIRGKAKRTCGDSMECIVKDLNPLLLRGWFFYFKHVEKWTIVVLDSFVRWRLHSLRRKQMTGRTSFGITKKSHKLMPNAYFFEHAFFFLKEAYVMVCQSRWGKY